MRAFLLSLLFILFIESICFGQTDSTKNVELNHNILPLAFYLPETSLGLGVLGIVTYRQKDAPKDTRPSQFVYSATFTFKKQLLLYFPYQINWKEGKKRLEGELGYYRYFYSFYGLGPNSEVDDLVTYNANFPRISSRYLSQVAKSNFIAIGFKYDHFALDLLGRVIFEENNYVGKAGGSFLQCGAGYIFDSRNNLFYPSNGVYLDLNFDFALKSILNENSFSRLSLDIRTYSGLRKDLILANQFNYSRASSATPFFYLPYISSTSLARGFADRRFIDREISSFQTELRYRLIKRFFGATFLSVNNVGDNYNGLSLKYSGGLGIRYELDEQEKNRVRLDLGFSGEGFNIYLTVNEAF